MALPSKIENHVKFRRVKEVVKSFDFSLHLSRLKTLLEFVDDQPQADVRIKMLVKQPYGIIDKRDNNGFAVVDPTVIYLNDKAKVDVVAILGCYADGCGGILHAVLYPCSWIKVNSRTFSGKFLQQLANKSVYSLDKLKSDAQLNTLGKLEEIAYGLSLQTANLTANSDIDKILDFGFDNRENLYALALWNVELLYEDEINPSHFKHLMPETVTIAEMQSAVRTRPRLSRDDGNLVAKKLFGANILNDWIIQDTFAPSEPKQVCAARQALNLKLRNDKRRRVSAPAIDFPVSVEQHENNVVVPMEVEEIVAVEAPRLEGEAAIAANADVPMEGVVEEAAEDASVDQAENANDELMENDAAADENENTDDNSEEAAENVSEDQAENVNAELVENDAATNENDAATDENENTDDNSEEADKNASEDQAEDANAELMTNKFEAAKNENIADNSDEADENASEKHAADSTDELMENEASVNKNESTADNSEEADVNTNEDQVKDANAGLMENDAAANENENTDDNSEKAAEDVSEDQAENANDELMENKVAAAENENIADNSKIAIPEKSNSSEKNDEVSQVAIENSAQSNSEYCNMDDRVTNCQNANVAIDNAASSKVDTADGDHDSNENENSDKCDDQTDDINEDAHSSKNDNDIVNQSEHLITKQGSVLENSDDLNSNLNPPSPHSSTPVETDRSQDAIDHSSVKTIEPIQLTSVTLSSSAPNSTSCTSNDAEYRDNGDGNEEEMEVDATTEKHVKVPASSSPMCVVSKTTGHDQEQKNSTNEVAESCIDNSIVIIANSPSESVNRPPISHINQPEMPSSRHSLVTSLSPLPTLDVTAQASTNGRLPSFSTLRPSQNPAYGNNATTLPNTVSNSSSSSLHTEFNRFTSMSTFSSMTTALSYINPPGFYGSVSHFSGANVADSPQNPSDNNASNESRYTIFDLDNRKVITPDA